MPCPIPPCDVGWVAGLTNVSPAPTSRAPALFFDEDRHEIGVIPEKRGPRKERGSFRCQTEEGVSTGRMSYTAVGPPSEDLRRPRFVKMFTLAYETSIDLRSRPK